MLALLGSAIYKLRKFEMGAGPFAKDKNLENIVLIFLILYTQKITFPKFDYLILTKIIKYFALKFHFDLSCFLSKILNDN